MKMDRKTKWVLTALMLVVGGFAAAVYPAPLYETTIKWETPIGRLVDEPCRNCERVEFRDIVGSYHPYGLPGWLAVAVGVVMLLSAAAPR